jgi:uncharacterized membrane protein
MKAKDFLTKGQLTYLASCIGESEHQTSGEIRIHIDTKCPGDARERAIKTFHLIGMRKTAARNGVLIYVACESRKFAVIGDKGINEVVPRGFWKNICDDLSDKFSTGSYVEGLETAVRRIGEKLKTYFPYDENDVNELPDDVSLDENDQ